MTVLVIMLATLLFPVASSRLAYASCNEIPDRPVRFLSVLGSIDRPFVSPDRNEVVTLQSIPGSKPSREHSFTAKDVLVTIIFKPPAAPPHTVFIAGNDDCDSLEEPACFLERLACHRHRTCFSGEAVGLAVTGENNLQHVSFHFPETGFTGPVTIAVTHRDQQGHNVPPLGLQRQTCQGFITSAAESNLTICVDTFRRPVVDPPGDATFADLLALAPPYDYRAGCTHHVGDPKCLGTAKDIPYTVGPNGDVVIHVLWQKILRPKGSGLDQRQVRASTAVEAVFGQGTRIFVPSARFLQTSTHLGRGFSPSPVFDRAELPDRPNEQTFIGTADEPESVLTFKRRVEWNYTCDAGTQKDQACDSKMAGQDCPAAQCVEASAGYFACDAGDRYRLPCTQTAQCPQGACRRISDVGSVCVTIDGTTTTTACKQDSDCGPNEECGPGLFEFRGRKDGGVITRIANHAPGVCDTGIDEGNACTTSSTCNSSVFGSVKCVTYRAEALTYSQ